MEILQNIQKVLVKKGHTSEKKKMHFKLSPLIVGIAVLIVNTYSEFQVNIFSISRDVVFAQRRQRQSQGISNTSGFLRKQPS